MKTLLKLSLTISIFGILLLIITATHLHPTPTSTYQQLSNLKQNQLATTTGKITSIRSYDNFNIINLDNNLTLIFNSKLIPKTNQTITATGKVSIYENQKQIQAEKIISN